MFFLIVFAKRTTSTWHIMKEICADLGYKGLFAGTYNHFCELKTGFGCWNMKECFCFSRFYAQGDQSSPGLCRYDQQLWVREDLLPTDEPWSAAAHNLKAAGGTRAVWIESPQTGSSRNRATWICFVFCFSTQTMQLLFLVRPPPL